MRSFHLLLLLSTFLLYSYSVTAQKTFLEGRVIDELGQPLPYACIKIFGMGRSFFAISDSVGYYQTYIMKTTDSIVCSEPGYKNGVELIEGNNIINFTLAPAQPDWRQKQFLFSVNGTHKYTLEELQKRTADSIVLIEKVKKYEKAHEDQIYTKMLADAEYWGGNGAMNRFLASAIVYPDSATISDVKGTVKVRFTVAGKSYPNITKVTLVKGVNKYCDSAVLNAVAQMKDWKPARINGKYFDMDKELSVSFDIKGIMPAAEKKEKKNKH